MLGSSVAAAALVLLVSVGAGPMPMGGHGVPTTTVVAVAATTDGGTTVTVTVAATDGTASGTVKPSGTVTVRDGTATVAVLPVDHGTARLTTTSLAPDVAHTLTAQFAGDDAHAGSTSTPVTVGASVGRSGPDPTVVTVVIPVGSLTITSGAVDRVDLSGAAGPRRARATGATHVVVTDTRAGNLGFTVSVSSATGGGPGQLTLTDGRATQVEGNGLDAADVVTLRGAQPLVRGRWVVVATYPGGISTGSVEVRGTIAAPGAPHRGRVVRVVWTVV